MMRAMSLIQEELFYRGCLQLSVNAIFSPAETNLTPHQAPSNPSERIRENSSGLDGAKRNLGAGLEPGFDPGLRLRLHPGYIFKLMYLVYINLFMLLCY